MARAMDTGIRKLNSKRTIAKARIRKVRRLQSFGVTPLVLANTPLAGRVSTIHVEFHPTLSPEQAARVARAIRCCVAAVLEVTK